MCAEAAGTKAALDAIGRRAHQGIGAGAVGGRHNHQTWPRGSSESGEISWCHGRDVDRDQQDRQRAQFHGTQTRCIRGNAVADLLVLFKDQRSRAARVVVKAQDEYGKWSEREGTELLARAFQHEIDHLNGILFIFRISALKRDLILRRIRKMQRAGEW